MDPPQTLASTVSALQASLSALHPQLNVLTASLAASSAEGLGATQSHLADAASILHRLLAFLNTSTRRGSVPSPARENGELQFLLAHLFGAFALAEGEALAATQASEVALSSIASFQTSQVSPLLRDFSSAKERALVLVAQATTKVAVANENKMHMELKLQGNRESVEATSKHLDEVQARLNTMACSMETLVEKKRELEERKLEAKEKRELQRSQKAVGFLSVFVPVLAPVAAAAAVFSSRALDGELRRTHDRLDSLRRQTESLNPALIESALKGLNLEHASIQHGLEEETAVVETLSAEKSALEHQLLELDEVHESLDAVCGELTRTQSAVAEAAAKVGDLVAKAAHAKGVCAQGVANSIRMPLEESRRWVVGLLEGVVEAVGEGREELDACKEEVQQQQQQQQQEVPADEAFESGGESPLVGRKDSGEWEGPGLLAVVESPEEEEQHETLEPQEDTRRCGGEDHHETREPCECEEDESDEEAPETVDVGIETQVHEHEQDEGEETERVIIDAVHPADEPIEEQNPTNAVPLEREPSVPGSYLEDSDDDDDDEGVELEGEEVEYEEDEEDEEDEEEEEEEGEAEGEDAYSVSSSVRSSESHVQDAADREICVLGSSEHSSPSPSDDGDHSEGDGDNAESRHGLDIERKCHDLVNVQIAPVPEVAEVHEIDVVMPGSFH